MTGHRRYPLQLVESDAEPDSDAIISYTSRNGHTYYLHEGVTKTGKPRYFVRKTVGDRACTGMPGGFEFYESLNGVVSVRRVRGPSPIPDADVERARAELGRHAHLRDYLVERCDEGLVVFEPEPLGISDDPVTNSRLEIRRELVEKGLLDRVLERRRYHPVLRFAPGGPGEGYVLMRMTWRGEGGWKQIDGGPLEELLRYLRVLGTDEFFQLN